MTLSQNDTMQRRQFYDHLHLQGNYASHCYAETGHRDLEAFVVDYELQQATVLDVGCGRGWFADLTSNWIGLDISLLAGEQSAGHFICASAEAIPLADRSVEAIWSITFLEHSSDPEKTLAEMTRVLRDGGVIYLAPAWRVPPWRAKGYEVRPYDELDLRGRIVKLALPVINLIWQKGVFWVPLRLVREITWAVLPTRTRLFFVSFEPNLTDYPVPDSDACSSLDSHEVLLWFLTRGFKEASTRSFLDRVLIRCRPLILTKPRS